MPDQHEFLAFAEVLNSEEKPILAGGQAGNLPISASIRLPA
jgi:hypothetical protein